MKTPTFYEGVGLALAAAVTVSVVDTTLSPLFGEYRVGRLLIAALGLGYVIYLLYRSRERVGRITTLSAWLVTAVGGWLLIPGLTLYAVLHLAMLWLVRSLYHQPGVLASLADLGLNVLALMVGTWAWLHSGSLLLGVWSFFLVQALFVAIPGWFSKTGSVPTNHDDDERFQQASRAADAALRRLSTL